MIFWLLEGCVSSSSFFFVSKKKKKGFNRFSCTLFSRNASGAVRNCGICTDMTFLPSERGSVGQFGASIQEREELVSALENSVITIVHQIVDVLNWGIVYDSRCRRSRLYR